MKTITLDLIQILQSNKQGKESVQMLQKQVEEIQANFYLEEKLLSKETA